MKANEMTFLQKAIFNAIKEHTTNPDNNYLMKNKPIEFISMSEGARENIRCYNGITLTHYTVKTRHKAEKYEDNITIWDICIYSNGDCGIYFDGTSYMQY